MFGAEVEIQSGMTFSFEPTCMFGRRYVNLGGTVAVGEERAIELNHVATDLIRGLATGTAPLCPLRAD